MIHETLMDKEIRSYGGALYEVLIAPDKIAEWEADREYMFFPHGTVITNDHMAWALKAGYQPFFVQCGWNGETLDKSLVEQSLFLGARGLLTQEELSYCDVYVEVLGEPSEIIVDKIDKASPNGFAIAIRNILDPGEYAQDTKFFLKADMMVSPVIEDREDIIEVTRLISGARFVLSGSLSAAAVAHAYGVPFAPMRTDFEDNPIRWQDWFTSIGVDITDFNIEDFPKDVREGRDWYNSYFRMEN
jgi:hypothetical protein